MSNETAINTIYDNAAQASDRGCKLNPYRKMTAEHFAYELGHGGDGVEVIAHARADGQVFGLHSLGGGEFAVVVPEDMAEAGAVYEILSDACDYLVALVLQELYRLWDTFGDTPVFPDPTDEFERDSIEEPFLHFAVGTPREDIWRWFETQHPKFCVGEVMSGRRQMPDTDPVISVKL